MCGVPRGLKLSDGYHWLFTVVQTVTAAIRLSVSDNAKLDFVSLKPRRVAHRTSLDLKDE